MSTENDVVESRDLNRLENLIDSNQTDLKREVESLIVKIDRRFGSLREEVKRLKSPHSALDQIHNGLALLFAQDNRRDLRDILSTITSRLHSNDHTTTSTLELDSSEVGGKDTVETANLGGDELGTEEQGNSLDTNVPLTLTANDANLNESTGGNEQVNVDSTNLSSISTTIDTDQSINETSMQQSNETTLDASKMWWDSYMEVYMEDEDDYHQIDVPEGGQEGNDNQNEYLQEGSNIINQSFDNDNQIDQQMNKDDQSESNSTINVDHNESSTSEQSNTRKRRRAGKSLTTECSSLENSLPSAEVSTYGSMTMSKRARVSSTLNRRESTEEVNTQSGVALSDDDSNGGEIGSSGEGEENVEQSENEESWWRSETELGDEEKGHYRIEILKLKCIEDGCNAEVASRDELHCHLRFDHLTSSPYRCLAKGCFERFETTGWDGLGIHVKDNHPNISTWPCPHCTKTYKSQSRLYHHLHYYHFEGQFKCGYDGCHYDRVATLRVEIWSHQNSVHPKTTIFTCQFNDCGKSFTQKSNLNRHQRIHTGVKPFRCGWTGCGKSFTQKGSLNLHQRIHTGVKPFRCGWTGCSKSFTTKDSLNVHQRIHQKVKPYKCTWNRCGYAATQLGHVIQHIRTQHFGLPKTQTEQRQLGIEDNRDPRDYFFNTITHQSDHNSTDSDDSDH